MIKLLCPFCGSGNTQTTGGENGNPFGKLPEKTVCLDCGRTIREGNPEKKLEMPDLTKPKMHIDLKIPVVRLTVTSDCKGNHWKKIAIFPYEDGEYSLEGYGYPMSRYSPLKISGDRVELDGDISKLMGQVLETENSYTVYDVDKVPWKEIIHIKIETDWI